MLDFEIFLIVSKYKSSIFYELYWTERCLYKPQEQVYIQLLHKQDEIN